MAEYARTEYNFNDRIVLNDVTTDPTKYVLLGVNNITDSLVINTEDEKPGDVGVIDYGSKISKGEWTVPIQLVATTQAKMSELIQLVKQAFNPDLLEADSTYGNGTKYLGYHPLKWPETVGSTSYNFVIYAKAQEIPKVNVDSYAGLIRKSDISLKVADPRKYDQTQSTRSGAGTATNAGTFATPVMITVTASGASSTSLQITNSTTGESIYVTTALSDGDVLVIDTGTHSVKLNGTEKRSMLGSGTDWWMLDPGSNTLAVSNDTNVTVSFAWYSAWPI